MPHLPPELLTRPPVKGDTVVHLDHGLCRLGPVRRMELSDGVVHTVELRFRDGETLAVPLTDAVRIWNYGASVPKGRLDRVGSDDWSARQAQRLLELRAGLNFILQGRRERDGRSDGAVGLEKSSLERAGEGFAHTLTECQDRVLAEITDDLRASRPTNRLLVGDVGCGKTEVAVRALLATALSGHRVRMVAPTRVLARQHYETLRARADALGLHVALCSGDCTGAERRDMRERLGEIDIVVGTRGALELDAHFALTVLDEEQKFGADAKTTTSNLLRLSATPIPRTLAEAKVGLAELSLITSYPKGRGKTRTITIEDTDEALVEELETELRRGGRALVLCARIRDLKRVRGRLAGLMPEARIDRVHGKRKPKRNRAALAGFRDGSVDVLLATSMLETGLDVPDANLMLVFAPHRFGLGQLHQLRGRVGRGSRDATFALVRSAKTHAKKKGGGKGKAFRRRLRALEQMDRRGDGLRLAVADAVLRGAGSVVTEMEDKAQSGHVSALGLELYAHLLDVATREGASRADILRAVPHVSGQWDWELDGSESDVGDDANDDMWDEAVRQSRAALADPQAALTGNRPYARLVAAAFLSGAHRAVAGPKGVTLDFGGDSRTFPPELDAVAAFAGHGAVAAEPELEPA